MKKYPKFKETKVEWIGEIPDEWSVKKVKYSLLNNEGIKIGPFGSSLKLETLCDNGIKIYGQGNIIANDFNLGNRYLSIDKFDAKFKQYEIIDGDVLITMMGTTGKSKVFNSTFEKGILDSHLLRLRFDPNKINKHLFTVILQEADYVKLQFNLNSKGSIMDGLNSSIIKELIIITPPILEQSQIISFLDQKTSIIDDILQKKLQKIELLKEQRTSIINHAVTKGLCPDVRMKDSGVEWIGEIPEHWRRTKLKSKFKSTGGGTPSKENSEYWNGNIPWVSPKDMKSKYIDNSEDKITQIGLENSATNLVSESSLLIVVRSGILQRTIPIGLNTVPVTFNQDLKSLQAISGDSVDFLYYFIKGNEENLLKEWSKVGATVESIEMEFMNNSKIPLPPIPEQHQIVEYLDKKTSEIDKQVDLKNRKIDLLKEYRQSLISEVVTGKIDVRSN